ncbi:hypothetical protein PR048_011815, partial [Dryococelus australis]
MKYSKPLKKWVTTNVYDNKTHEWRREILRIELPLELDNGPYIVTNISTSIDPLLQPESLNDTESDSKFTE